MFIAAPLCDTLDEFFAWADSLGLEIVRSVIWRGPDRLYRGSVSARRRSP